MAYAILAHTSAGSANDNDVTTGALDTSGADLLIVVVATFANPIIVVTDSNVNVWSARTQYADNHGVQLFFVQGGSVGSGHTFTATTLAGFPSIAVLAVSGSQTTPYDVENGATGGGVDFLQPGSITPSVDNELVVSGCSSGANYTLTIDAPFTLADNTPGDNNHHEGVGLAYEIQTSATARNPTWTSSSPNANLAATIASFKASAGGVGGTLTWMPTTRVVGGHRLVTVPY